MATAATISGFKLQLGDGASPNVYSTIEEVLSMSGFGKTNELLDVTNWDSPQGTKEFIAGLAEGSEITVELNYTGATQQDAVKAAVDAGQTKDFRVLNTNTSPNETYQFSAVCIGWTIDPSATEQNKRTFTLKISGDIV